MPIYKIPKTGLVLKFGNNDIGFSGGHIKDKPHKKQLFFWDANKHNNVEKGDEIDDWCLCMEFQKNTEIDEVIKSLQELRDDGFNRGWKEDTPPEDE
jgi:hypothetical protein